MHGVEHIVGRYKYTAHEKMGVALPSRGSVLTRPINRFQNICFSPPQDKVSSIPSLVIEPASNNEGEGEEHEVIVNESKDVVEDVGTQGIESDACEPSQVVSEQKTIEEIQTTSSEEQPVSADDAAHGMPPGFLFKVEALHDFEAGNTDELNLKRGDTVLVIPSEATDDQEAGWLTGIKESDWLQYRDAVTYKGLFPENFTKPLE
uniref:SH3 domain-containing protein n=1 Tax=Chelydra serpentina TaxID=8475 RepID=A0A8C3SBR0_CHESE